MLGGGGVGLAVGGSSPHTRPKVASSSYLINLPVISDHFTRATEFGFSLAGA